MSLRCVEKVESTEFGNILGVGYNGEVKDTQILALKVKWRPHRQWEPRRRCEEWRVQLWMCATSIWSR